MGYALAWLAVKGMSPDNVRKVLRLDASQIYEECPEADYTGVNLGNWYVVLANGSKGIRITRADYARLSNDREAIFCCVEEHVMFSQATGWRDGQRIWSVYHESDKGIEHLYEGGELPAEFEAIKSRLTNLQKTAKDRDIVDYIFDIPIELAKSITGFCHDRDIQGQDKPFEVLIPDPKFSEDGTKKKSWWSRLISR